MRHLTRVYTLLASVATLLFVSPAISFAQQTQQTDTRIIVVQTFKVPRAEWDGFFSYVDKYVLPRIKANPHILGYRMADHYYGTAEPNIWVIIEFANLGAVQQADLWSENYLNDNYPDGTAKRDSLNALHEKYYLPYWQNHTDNILMMNVKRMK